MSIGGKQNLVRVDLSVSNADDLRFPLHIVRGMNNKLMPEPYVSES